MKSRWDERCPHCSMKINMSQAHQTHDYQAEFAMDCPHCSKIIAVDVHSVPEYELTDPTKLSKWEREGYGLQ